MRTDSPRAPDTVLVVLAILVLAAALTWIVPSGHFEREIVPLAGGGEREQIVPGSFRLLGASRPQGAGALLLAPFGGFVRAADIIAFVLIVGGAFRVLNATGAVEAGLARLVEAARHSPRLDAVLLPVLMLAFSLGGAVFGMAEETVPFILMLVPLSRALGYDAITGAAIPIVGAGAGFAGAFLNPFTVGVAQGIAELPLFSGLGYRLVVWLAVTALAIAYVMRHARRVRHPASVRDATAARSRAPAPPLTARQRSVLVVLGLGMGALVGGVMAYDWYIAEIAALFLALGIAFGGIGGLGALQSSRRFMEGARDLAETAILIGMARGIIVLLEDGAVVDTILHALAGAVGAGGPLVAAESMFLVQTGINFFVPSGSGQAALTMPIMAPLSDLVGVTRQTAVLAFQLGDGFTNIIIPTNAVLIGSLSLAGVSWLEWARWMLPLQAAFLLLGAVLLGPPALLGWTG